MRTKIAFPRRNHRSYLGLLAALHLSGCNTGGDFGAGIGVGKRDSADQSEEDGKDESADIPAEVTGAFLTCAYMDDQKSITGKIQADPNGEVEVTCGIFANRGPEGVALVESSHLSFFARTVLPPDGRFGETVYKRNRIGSQMHFNALVPAKYLAGGMQVDVSSLKARDRATFMKAFSTIKTFNVRNLGFNINDDMAANGISLTGQGSFTINPEVAEANRLNLAEVFLKPLFTVIAEKWGSEYTKEPIPNTGVETMCDCGVRRTSRWGGASDGTPAAPVAGRQATTDGFTTNNLSDYSRVADNGRIIRPPTSEAASSASKPEQVSSSPPTGTSTGGQGLAPGTSTGGTSTTSPTGGGSTTATGMSTTQPATTGGGQPAP